MRRALLASVSMAVVLGACSDGGDFGPSRTEEGANFATAIERARGHVITFQSVFGDDFETAVVACPFVGPDDVKKTLGFNWADASKLPLEDESASSVVLTQGRRVIHVEVLDSKTVNLCAVGDVGVVAVEPTRELTFSPQANTDGSSGWATDLVVGR